MRSNRFRTTWRHRLPEPIEGGGVDVLGRGLWRIPEEALDAYIQAGLEHTAQAVAEAATASEPEQS